MRNRLIGGILGVLLLATLPAAAFAQLAIGVSVNAAPPPLPVYAQPSCPGVGYMWTPGYWAWGDGDYYWVPGTWVMAPQPGLLWTPGWWGWSGGAYVWNPGYWGPQVGFYGGVNYGFGYSGNGYGGGYWRGNQFYYNRSVNNVTNTTNITNIYNAPPPPSAGASHVSYNGGQGGLSARPTAEQVAYEHAHHVGPTAAQTQHEQAASRDRQLRASVNHGKPAIAATAKPGQFSGKDVVAAIAAGGAVHAAARSASSERHAPQQAPQAARRPQQEEQPRTTQAEHPEQRQHAAQPSSPIREAQAHPGARPQPPHASAHSGTPPRPKPEEKPRGQG
jgi:WXXGXW repeat (2 copies)